MRREPTSLPRRAWLALAPGWLLAACADAPLTGAPVVAAPAPAPAPAVANGEDPPPPPREFRGAWVATVNNIDWPSKPGLAPEAARAECLALLERAREIGLNAIVLQVRPAGDALYVSALEPWSEYLTGEQGRAPQPPWDPLAFWVEQAHRRGLELHAWFNPYRARHPSAKTPLVAPHLGVRAPALVKRYADLLWMDPGEAAAAAHTLAVVADVVRRYDVDGVHIDDYFYPYPAPVPGSKPPETPGAPVPEIPFPDDESWARYQLGGGTLARDDWRRDNVNRMVQALQRVVREIKPWVRFGVSPFGIGKPERRPAGISGFSQYDKLYADAELWLEQGWLDYLAPQLYWPIAREGQQFPVLLDYWLGANPARRHVWPGLFTSQVQNGQGPRAWPARELLDQVAVLRTRAEPAPGREHGAGGHIHFSMVALQQDRDGLATLLRMGPYAQPALAPATPWLTAPAVRAPVLRAVGTRVRIEPAAGEAAQRWAVWKRVGGSGGSWQFSVLAAPERNIEAAGAERVVVFPVDRVGRLGERAMIRLP